MPIWNTKKIIKDLKTVLTDIKKIKNQGQGGDVDTENLYIEFKNTADCLYICGFNSDGEITDPTNEEVEMVEITDGLQTGKGLSSRDKKFAIHYMNARQYFLDQNFKVVDSIKAFF